MLASAPGATLEEERARLGHPAREVLERDGESGKRTLLLASKFTEAPPSRTARLQSDRGSHELGVYRLLAARLEPSFDEGLERRPRGSGIVSLPGRNFSGIKPLRAFVIASQMPCVAADSATAIGERHERTKSQSGSSRKATASDSL